jgi:hypothetical protein
MLAERWNGRRWAVLPVVNAARLPFSALAGVSCSSARSCVAVGMSGQYEDPQVALAGRWSGKKLIVGSVASPAGAAGSSLVSVSCRRATACMAAGYYQDSSLTNIAGAERWNGVSWAFTPLPSG